MRLPSRDAILRDSIHSHGVIPDEVGFRSFDDVGLAGSCRWHARPIRRNADLSIVTDGGDRDELVRFEGDHGTVDRQVACGPQAPPAAAPTAAGATSNTTSHARVATP